MNVKPSLIELLLDEEADLEALRADPWVLTSLRKATRRKGRSLERELLIRLREIFYQILIWRRTYLSEGSFGERVSKAYEELERVERKLVFEGSESVFAPLYREVAKRYADIRSIDRDISRLESLKNPHRRRAKKTRRGSCSKCKAPMAL